jgi:hypothetical protein
MLVREESCAGGFLVSARPIWIDNKPLHKVLRVKLKAHIGYAFVRERMKITTHVGCYSNPA